MEKHEIRLRKMSEEDFSRFREYSIFDYAETMLKAGSGTCMKRMIPAKKHLSAIF